MRSIYEVFDNLTTDDEKLKTFTRLSVPITTSKILEDLLTRYLLPKESEEAVITPDANDKQQTKSSQDSNTILPTNSRVLINSDGDRAYLILCIPTDYIIPKTIRSKENKS